MKVPIKTINCIGIDPYHNEKTLGKSKGSYIVKGKNNFDPQNVIVSFTYDPKKRKLLWK